MAECARCAVELAAMEATWNLLDEWRPPQLSPFFDTRLYARLRTEQSNAPAGLLEQTRAWLLYRCNLQMGRLTGVALALVLVIGGAPFALLDRLQTVPVIQISETVKDLQSYDRNADLIEQLDALDNEDDGLTGASN